MNLKFREISEEQKEERIKIIEGLKEERIKSLSSKKVANEMHTIKIINKETIFTSIIIFILIFVASFNALNDLATAIAIGIFGSTVMSCVYIIGRFIGIEEGKSIGCEQTFKDLKHLLPIDEK